VFAYRFLEREEFGHRSVSIVFWLSSSIYEHKFNMRT